MINSLQVYVYICKVFILCHWQYDFVTVYGFIQCVQYLSLCIVLYSVCSICCFVWVYTVCVAFVAMYGFLQCVQHLLLCMVLYSVCSVCCYIWFYTVYLVFDLHCTVSEYGIVSLNALCYYSSMFRSRMECLLVDQAFTPSVQTIKHLARLNFLNNEANCSFLSILLTKKLY